MAIYRLCVAVCCLILAQASKVEDVQDLNYEPKVAVICGQIAKHVDVDSGKWIADANQKTLCSNDTEEILKYCQKTYPGIDITNIVEANEKEAVCTDGDCKSSFNVVPFRCLVGQFEADALSYPPNAGCDFGYVHEVKTCKHHDYWHERANKICEAKGKKLEKYGILVPCGTDVFTGVEYVCCKRAKTAAEIFEDLVNKFANHVPNVSEGCDRSMYNMKTRALGIERDIKVQDVAKKLQKTKARMHALKKDDPVQAKALYKSALDVFKSTVKNIQKQSKLDMLRLHQERRECIQMDINHKKHMAMKSFVAAAKQYRDKPAKILKTFKRFMRIIESDEAQNARFLTKALHSSSGKAKVASNLFMSHSQLLHTLLEEAVDILKHIDSIAGKVDFVLPVFARDIDFNFPEKPKTVKPSKPSVNPTDPPSGVTNGVKHEADDAKIKKDEDEERENEHQRYDDESRPVFAAVIGLSCGALVIMVVIVLALFFRKGSSSRPTKTVIAENDSQEKRHLLKMQEDGFENPTYKFFAN